jgi:hypothetical protein
VNKILKTQLKNQTNADVEIIDLIFIPLFESFPSLSSTKKASAKSDPIVTKLDRSAKNLLVVTSAEIIAL